MSRVLSKPAAYFVVSCGGKDYYARGHVSEGKELVSSLSGKSGSHFRRENQRVLTYAEVKV
jgi:hypothetical protein